MPELPEVESLRASLRESISASKLLSVKVLLERLVRIGSLNDLVGARVNDILRKGKLMKVRFSNEQFLFLHMGMTGTTLVKAKDEPINKFTRVVFQFEDCDVWFQDIRTFGALWVSKEDIPMWKEMGVDPFEEGYTLDYIRNLLTKSKCHIKSILMNQKAIAGIGNIYASEILFASGIHPLRPANSLTDKEIRRVYKFILAILTASIMSKGTTFRDFKLSNGKSGEFQNFLQVYGKQGVACIKCNNPIISQMIQQRNTFFCVKCQK